MKQYLDLVRHILDNGTPKSDRTGTGTKSVFGYQMRFDLGEGFPLLTTKRLPFSVIIHELLWFLSGSTNNNDLRKHGVTIWDEWARENGDLGPIYGQQWRNWGDRGIDQITTAIDLIKKDPDSRRNVVSAWNVADLPFMALQPCHIMFQLYVAHGRLSLHMYQRSADVFLGLPFNIASYAALLTMMAHVTALDPGEMIISLGDAHIYNNHVDQCKLQLTRKPFHLPLLMFKNFRTDIFDFVHDDFVLHFYESHPHIKGDVSK